MSDNRKGDWMITASGRKFYAGDARPGDFDIHDIARGLARANRFAGQSLFPYSVAQHSVMCARMSPRKLAFTVLMHDASEAYVQDIARPAKRQIQGYKEIEEGIMVAIGQQFGFAWPPPEEVHVIDNRMLVTEAAALLPPSFPWWKEDHRPAPYSMRIEPWDQTYAEYAFLQAFELFNTNK